MSNPIPTPTEEQIDRIVELVAREYRTVGHITAADRIQIRMDVRYHLAFLKACAEVLDEGQ